MAEVEREGTRLARDIARILDECRASHAVHARKLKELCALRSSSSSSTTLRFFPSFAKTLTPLFDYPRRTLSSERVVRFVSAFASHRDGSDVAASDAFLEEFLRFLIAAAAAAHRPARFRSCQMISEASSSDDAEVSDEVWDEVIDSMKVRVQDKIPAIRAFAVRALSRFAIEGDDAHVLDIFLQTLAQEQNAEVRKTIVLSLPPSNATLEAIVGSTLDVSESVRKAAYCVLATKFPLQSLSIKHRTTLLQRGLSDRSSIVIKECLKMLKDEWLAKCCEGDPITLLRFLDVETYESVGEAVMEALLKEGLIRVQEGQSMRHYSTSHAETEGQLNTSSRRSPSTLLLSRVIHDTIDLNGQLFVLHLRRRTETLAAPRSISSATICGGRPAPLAGRRSQADLPQVRRGRRRAHQRGGGRGDPDESRLRRRRGVDGRGRGRGRGRVHRHGGVRGDLRRERRGGAGGGGGAEGGVRGVRRGRRREDHGGGAV